MQICSTPRLFIIIVVGLFFAPVEAAQQRSFDLPDVPHYEIIAPSNNLPLRHPYYKGDFQHPNSDNRGTENNPFFVKELSRETSEAEKAQIDEKSNPDRKLTEYTGDLAFYTEWLFAATLFLAIFTGALATAAFIQMRDARRAIAAAETSAKASERHAGTAERALTELERAFIGVEFGGIRQYRGNDDRIACDVIIHNAGNLPARKVSWWIGKEYSDDGNKTDFPISTTMDGNIVIVPKTKIRKGSNPPTTKQILSRFRDNSQPGKAWLYIWGRVAYNDGFRDGRVTTHPSRCEPSRSPSL